MNNLTCEDINALVNALCRKGYYVSLSIDIHDGEIKQVGTLWKSRGKEGISDFIKKLDKKNEK